MLVTDSKWRLCFQTLACIELKFKIKSYVMNFWKRKTSHKEMHGSLGRGGAYSDIVDVGILV